MRSSERRLAIYEEVYEAASESGLANSYWKRRARAARTFHLAFEEERNVVEHSQHQDDAGRHLGSPHAAKMSTERQTDGDVAVDGHQQNDPDGPCLTDGRRRPGVRYNVWVQRVDKRRQLVGEVVQRFQRLNE